MNTIAISSNDLIVKNCPSLPSKAKDFSTINFWYYTSLSTANKILDNKCVYISNLSKMNDIDEATLHNDEKRFVHCFCLCNSSSERIPMWYLYSGISGKGAALGLTPATMIKLINSIETVSTTDGSVTLYKGKDFDLDFGWIFYRKADQTDKIFYRNRWYSLNDPSSFEFNNYFIKSYPWEYEREFRIVIHNKTGISYDRLVINLAPVYEQIRLKLAPEITDELFSNLLPQLHGINKFLSKKTLHSDLSINMNLFQRNFDGFLEYISTNSGQPDSGTSINYASICSAMSNHCMHKKE